LGKKTIGIEKMKSSFILILIAIMVFHGKAFADDFPPGFGDFQVQPFKGRLAKLQIVSEKDKQYATRLRELSHQKPNFAGHYTLVSWGCGASCVMAAAIDAETGKVTWLPFTLCCWDVTISEPLEFRRDSRLLVAHGSRNETGAGDYYYQIDASGFTLVKAYEKASTTIK
jgi:hypothetical protein